MTTQRKNLLNELEQIRDSKIICYIGADRQSISTRIAPDIIPVFYKHLVSLGPIKKLDLFLFTKGGDVLTALRLVDLIYEFTDQFSILIPYKAYSAGTLIALGASEIVMNKSGELSPIDPNVTSIYNPQDPLNATARLPVSVEDIYSFFSVTKNLGILNEDAMVQVFLRLLDSVQPLAIGSLYRSYLLIRDVAKKLLIKHLDSLADEQKINAIVNKLTKKFFSHNYIIGRKEALESLNLPIIYSSEVLESKIWLLYENYEAYLDLDKPYNPEISANNDGNFMVSCGIIESLHRSDEYIFKGILEKDTTDTVRNVNILEQGWQKIEEDNQKCF
ncbi:MAG: hypothetical protein P4L49_01925 [Desulfosporosinus sp.]|nr:hypothetical protein [Desulfosporosinus sp.]